MQNRFILQFVMYGGGYVNFGCPNKEVALIHIKNFIDGLEKMKETKLEAIIYADDETNAHVSMVRASQVIGYTLLDLEKLNTLTPGDEWKQ